MNITTIVYYYAILCTIAGGFILLITLSNVIWLSHTLFPKPLKKGPKVSVLIPARNEEKRIIPCLESLLVQDYQNYNIYLYDDDSTDGTGKILDHYAREYPGFVRVIHGGPLETGWFGKPHAMQKLLERSDGVYVLFTDADTLHKPDSIGRAVALAQRYEADLVTGYVHHTTGSFGKLRSFLPFICSRWSRCRSGWCRTRKAPRSRMPSGSSCCSKRLNLCGLAAMRGSSMK